MTPGETIATGATATCGGCGVTPRLQVCTSGGGANHYLGTMCECGPYSRESDYFPSRTLAEAALALLGTDDPTRASPMR